MQVTIFGPNLNSAAQRKGQFHVHAAGCADCKHYGPGTKHGGEDKGWTINAAAPIDVSLAVYADHAGDDNEPESQDWWDYLDSALRDFHFAPCVKFPKTNDAPKGQKEDTMSGKTIAAKADNPAQVIEAIQALFSVKVVEAKTYQRLTVDGKTIGYLKATSVDVPVGKGSYKSFTIQTKAQIAKAVTAMKRAVK